MLIRLIVSRIWLPKYSLRLFWLISFAYFLPLDGLSIDEHKQVLEGLIEERTEFDKTVWATEILAQKHEQVFIDLWDRLRISQDKWAVLQQLPFKTIELGQWGPFEHFDLGITSATMAQLTQKRDHSQWIKTIETLKAKGYRLIETEWHHSIFHPPEGDKPPGSVVSFVLHGEAFPEFGRFIIRGKLAVQWALNRLEAPQLEKLHVIKATMLNCEEKRFEPVALPSSTVPPTANAATLLALYDLNGDGLSEIIRPNLNLIYWNRGDWQFEPDTFIMKGSDFRGGSLLADFDHDGLTDFLCVEGKEGLLHRYEADESGLFSTPGVPCGKVGFLRPPSFTAGDIDGDGDLDLWACQYKAPYSSGQMPTPYYDANDGHPFFLFTNDGRGQFTDVTEASGLGKKRYRRAYSGSLSDLDEDGDLDLIVVSDFAGIDIYANDGHGQFSDVTKQIVGKRHSFGMSVTFGDYNIDGRYDFFLIGMSSTTAKRLHRMGLTRVDRPNIASMRPVMGYGNRMYLAGDKHFKVAQFNDSVASTGWSWGSTSFDFDNDGDRDIYVANGHRSGQSAKDYCTRFWCHDIYTGSSKPDRAVNDLLMNSLHSLNQSSISWNGFEHNALFMNQSGKDFVDIGFLQGVSFEFDSRAVASDDLDGDGRVDLLVSEIRWSSQEKRRTFLHLVRNQNATDNHWIGLHFPNNPAQASPIGSKITLYTEHGKQVERLQLGTSYRSQHASTLHFGLGESDWVSKIEIQWPDGKIQHISNPAIDRYHSIHRVNTHARSHTN